MKRHIGYIAIAAAAIVAATPAEAVVIVPGSSGLTFEQFNPATRGTQLAIQSQSGSAPTIAGTLVSAVYRNTNGFLDFYFQVSRTSGSNQIDGMNVGAFDNLLVDGFVDGSDFDGDGPFAATNNPEGSTTTVGRSANGVRSTALGNNVNRSFATPNARTLDRYFVGAPRTYTVSVRARF